MASKVRVILLYDIFFGPAHTPTARITILEDTKIIKYFKDRGYSEIIPPVSTPPANRKRRSRRLQNRLWFRYRYKILSGPGRYTLYIGATEVHLNRSLIELKTESVDIFYLHAPDRSTVDKLYKDGKFKISGISNYTAYKVAELVTLARDHGLVQPTLYQNPLECHHSQHRGRVDPCVTALRIGSRNLQPACWKPISGKYFRDLKHSLTMLEIALRGMVHHSQLKLGPAKRLTGDGIIIAVSSLTQMEEDLSAIEKTPLPEDVVESLDKAWKIVKSDMEWVINLPSWIKLLSISIYERREIISDLS
ncbi:NADP-dependent oxidoreductase domain-containing protein [Lipomyces starkeyi]